MPFKSKNKSAVCKKTGRTSISTEGQASVYAAEVRKGARAVPCPYCDEWHVVGNGSTLIRPKPTRKK